MKLLVILATALCVVSVSSSPLSEGDRLQSEELNRLMMNEADDEAAQRNKRTIGILRELFPDVSQNVNREVEDKVNEVAAESQNNEVKVQFADEQGNESAAPPLTPLEEVEAEDDENRNKRFLSGLGGSSSSGNFVFDIIRLVAGSGGDASAGKSEEPQEAIPGPVTRLFVIMNRGISNLVQDLILRLAATSERIVNFKARLITSII
ncbi:uncharacterized protein LOC122538121 isoform X3 [Frieseomelitta varia]|uniref:uncharacterized protein LOC122538121 isoform X3 n=1 Tax=Frieseomelitta varia TaxID=561572 RepID=UPI001CB68D7E|nr:uncharacterized protein LOC122538121 isoform X3 [Frieseomelitta varia]